MVQVRTLTTSNFGITELQTIVNVMVLGSTVRLVMGGIDDVEGRTTFDVDAGPWCRLAMSGCM